MNNNRCVACGAIIPEGRQVCPNCEKSSPKINDKQLVFICSPFHSYDEMQKLCNIENAKTYCRIASRQGYIPIAPHLFFPQFLNDDNPTERAAGIEMGKHLMQKCSKVWVCGNYISDGMREEIMFAQQNNIPYEHITCRGISCFRGGVQK